LTAERWEVWLKPEGASGWRLLNGGLESRARAEHLAESWGRYVKGRYWIVRKVIPLRREP